MAEIVLIGDTIFRPGRIFYINDNLVIFDRVEKDAFKVFSPNGKHLNSWGNLGQGPDASFDYIDINSFQQDGNFIEFIGYPVYNKYKVEKNGMLSLNRSVDLSFVTTNINRFCRLNNDLTIINHVQEGGSDSNEHVLLSMNKKIPLKKFGSYPEVALDFESTDEKEFFFLKNPVSSKEQEVLFTFYFSINLFKRYDFAGNELGQYSFANKISSLVPVESGKVFFMSPATTENYVYVLFVDKNNQEIEANIELLNPRLLVLDWKGNLIRHFKLDQPITSIAIDHSDKFLYGIRVNEDQPIVKYKLPSF